MSLSFKTVGIKSSTALNITKEQIDAVLYPVSIVLTEEVILAEDAGPVIESTAERTGSAPSINDDVFVSDGVPPITRDTIVSIGPWGAITVGTLQKEILDSFRESTYDNPDMGAGKLAIEFDGGFGLGTGGGNSDSTTRTGTGGPTGKA